MLDILCPSCKTKLSPTIHEGNFTILKCNCNEYPSYMGIVNLINNDNKNNTIKLVKSGNNLLAAKAFLNLPYRVFIPLFFLVKTGLSKILGFNLTIRLIGLFGYNNNWVKYLTKRKEIPYFEISKISIYSANTRGGQFLDIGCGAGILFPVIYRSLKPANTVGVDISPLNLYLARCFFNNEKLILVCCDVEHRLPFRAGCFDLIHMSDTLQYVKNKKNLIDEIGRLCKKFGTVTIPHTHNVSIKGKKIMGITRALIKKYLVKSGFKDIKIANDNTILVNNKPEYLNRISNVDAYSIVASKSVVNNSKVFRKVKIVILQPHLDDAILSTFFLIKKLKKTHLDTAILTVFTKGTAGPYSPQATSFLKLTGCKNANKLFTKFKDENLLAMNKLGIKFNNLDFVDAAFRKESFGRNLYNSQQEQFSGTISTKDKHIIKSVTSKVEDYVNNFQNVVFVCPLGIGGHVDHVITREAVRALGRPTIYYQEYPYNRNNSNKRMFFSENKKYKYIFGIANNNTAQKQSYIQIYKSQMTALFPDRKVDCVDEKYYILQA